MTLKAQAKKAAALAITSILVLTSFIILLSMVPPTIRADPPFSDNEKVNTDADTATQGDPSIFVDAEGTAYLVWDDYRNINGDIFFAKSIDGGASWTDPNKRVNEDSGTTEQSNPSIAVNSTGALHVVWQDLRNGDWDIYFANSTNGGATWSEPNVKINTDVGSDHQINPVIAVDSEDTIYIAWEDYRNGDADIYFAKSTDGGETWDPNKRVNTDSEDLPDQKRPTMAINSMGTIYIAWQDKIEGDWDIYIGKSTNGGTDWSDPSIEVNTDGGIQSQSKPTLAVGSTGNIYLAWQDYRNNDNDIYFARSTNEGATWTNPNKKVNSDSGTENQFEPTIAVGSTGTIYLAWRDHREGNDDIYFANSTDEGSTWTHPNKRVNDDTGSYTQLNPTIGVGSTGLVHLAWEDYRSDDSYDIYSASIEPVNPFPMADLLSVEGYYASTPGIQHIIPNEPGFCFRFNDPNSDPLAQYNISVWEAGGSSLLWWCNNTSSAPSGSWVRLRYNTAPCPTNGPPLIDGTSYKLRVIVKNDTGVWSAVSEVDFHMNEALAPTLVSPLDNSLITSSATQTVSWASPGTDAEGDTPVSYSWEVATDPSFTTVIESGSGLVTESGQFDTTPSGNFYWRVNLNDSWETGQYGNQPDGYWNFTTYTPSGSNNPPIITNKALTPTAVIVNYNLNFVFTATDPDPDTLSWSKIYGPTWLSIGSTNGTIYGIPSTGNIGANQFKIEVSDGRGGADNHTFTIEVNTSFPDNNQPIITNKRSEPTEATVNSALTFTFTATDDDLDPLTWGITGGMISGPKWLNIGASNGTIYGIPSSGNIGSNTFTIQVSDGKGGTDDHTFTITVNDQDDEDGDDGEPQLLGIPFLWILIIIIVIIVILLLIAIARRKKRKEAVPPPPANEYLPPPPP